ncbi:MAG: tetratricopeptide repeat protein, partial [Verrucomicrobiae bacterium]|nr:tetratricopeptide repeat protein [Verrucomicrobiae bacterium]
EALRLLAISANSPEETTNTLSLLQDLDAKHPNSAPVLLARSILELRQEETDAAEDSLQRVLALAPDLAEAYVQRARLEQVRSNVVAAENAMVRAVELAPTRSRIRVAYAGFKLMTGKQEEARAMVERLLKLAPDYNPAVLLMARIEAQAGDYEQALARTARVLDRDPLNLEAMQLRTQIHQVQKEPGKAASEWETFDQGLSSNPLIKFQLAQTYAAGGETAKEIGTLDRAILLSSGRLDAVEMQAHLLRARLSMQTGNAGGAVEALKQLLSQAANRTNDVDPRLLLDTRLLLIDAQTAAGRLDDAVATCQGLIQVAPENDMFQFFLGRLRRQQGRVEDAREAFRKSLEIAPGNLLSLYQLVDIEIAATNAPVALKLVQDQLASQTNSAPLKYLEGRVLAAQRKWPEAEAALRESLELNPEFSNSYQLLSGIYLAKTNLVAAARELETLVSRRTNDVGSMLVLGTL